MIEAEPGMGIGVAGPLVADVQTAAAQVRLRHRGRPACVDGKTEFVVTAFQRHFRPERVDGRIDQSTITTLGAADRGPAERRAALHEHRREDHGARRCAAADRLDLRAVLILIACCACWGVNQAAIKIANAGISPILQAGLARCCRACWCLPGRRRAASGCSSATARCGRASFAVLLFGLEFIILYVGLGLTTASRGVIFLYLSPFVVAFGAHYLIPGDRLTLTKLLGLDGGAARPGRRHGRGFRWSRAGRR